MTEPQGAASDCEHHFETRILGGHPLQVRICSLCRTPDWNDLAEQAAALRTSLEKRLRLAHQARRAKEHQLDAIRRALCDVGFMEDDDPYSHADLEDVIRQAGPALSDPTAAAATKPARLLDCGFCYAEQGEEVHPHPECPVGVVSGPVIGMARIGVDVQPGLTDGIASVELADGIVLPAVEFEGVDVLPLKGARLVLAGGAQSRFTVGGKRYPAHHHTGRRDPVRVGAGRGPHLHADARHCGQHPDDAAWRIFRRRHVRATHREPAFVDWDASVIDDGSDVLPADVFRNRAAPTDKPAFRALAEAPLPWRS
jgi:hypothetical protein